MNGREFDAQVVHTPLNSPRGELMQQYVLVRIMHLAGVDLNLFDYDRHNALYFFMLNADEYIYMRYGGRDTRSATSYLDLDSLELALRQGLEQHELYNEGQLPEQKRRPRLVPRDIITLKNSVIDQNRCVECHLVVDYQITEKETAGTLDKRREMYESPDLRRLGIELDVPRGLRVAEANGVAADAGIQAGDTLAAINGQAVLTFGDFQYYYNQVDRDATEIEISYNREGKSHTATVLLPKEWWWTDLSHRYWSVDPLVFFEAERLSPKEKDELGLPRESFASRVTEVGIDALLEGAHELEEGDLILSVKGVQIDPHTQDVITHIKLRHEAGSMMNLQILRGGKPMEMSLQTKRQRYRKRD